MEDIWSDDPLRRLEAVRKLSEAKRREILEGITCTAPKGHWPFGMPTSINPMILFLGPSPGGSPAKGDIRDETTTDYPSPTFGVINPGLQYTDSNGFWEKIRTIAVRVMAGLYGVHDREDALALAGLLNLSDKPSGSAAKVEIDETTKGWVFETITKTLRPHLVIAIGLKGRKFVVLRGLSYIEGDLKTREWTTLKDDGSALKTYQVLLGLRSDPAPQYLVFPHQHLSKGIFKREGATERFAEQLSTCLQKERIRPL